MRVLRTAAELVEQKVGEAMTDLITGAEDFSFFARQVHGVYFFIGVIAPEQDPAAAPSNHSDYFYLDDGIPMGHRSGVS